jgi:formate hydrogenlyase subunit 3/multisubunit Na+/H+ antiporter MnhD subunit
VLTVILSSVAVLLALPILAVARGPMRQLRTPLVYGATFAATVAGLASAAIHLSDAAGVEKAVFPLGLPWVGAHFELDPLSAFFVIVVDLGAALASLYGIGYGRHEQEPSRILPFFPIFVAGMNLVALSADAFTFLVSWESMSLASWALVIAHHRVAENRRAAFTYLLMASFGTLCLLLAFGVLAGPSGSYAFDMIRTAPHTGGSAILVLVLALLGAGSKAGLMPMHVWLPLAHPAAPSHVSALMSGVMTKVAIYGFIRIVFDLLGKPDWWSSLIVLAVGGGTAALGVLYAIMQSDLKRVLAYSTIENVGIVFVGLGLALAFQANDMGSAAALALTAALFHVFNHSIFKTLLFFGAGAVLTATGERNLEHLGGLIHRMKVTAFLFLSGCAAISALPPLNGFVSEWMIFQAVLLGPDVPQWGLKMMIPAVGGLLALAAALAAACFVRAFGIAFLGRPRTTAAGNAREVDRFSLAAMMILAALCLLGGILPGSMIDALAPVTQSLMGHRMAIQSTVPWRSLVPIAESKSSYNGLLVLVFIAASSSIAAMAIHNFASRAVRRSAAWDCGFPDPNPLTQYTAGSFGQPIRRVFGSRLFLAREQVDMPPPGDVTPARFTLAMHDVIWEALYAPLAGLVDRVATLLDHLQFLTIRRYLGFVFTALILLLLVLALW